MVAMLQMVCELLLERGDYILLEEYTYPSVIESVIVPKGYKPLAIKLDQNGILPESLLEVCMVVCFAESPPCRMVHACHDTLHRLSDLAFIAALLSGLLHTTLIGLFAPLATLFAPLAPTTICPCF